MKKLKKIASCAVLMTFLLNIFGICPIEVNAQEKFNGNIEFGTNYSGKGFKVNSLKAQRVGNDVDFTINYESPKDYNDFIFFNPPNGDSIMIIKHDAIKSGKHMFKITLSNKKFNELLKHEEMTMRFGFDDNDRNFIFFKTEQLKSLQDLSIPEKETFNGNIEFGTNYSGKGFKVNSLKAQRVKDSVEFTVNYESTKNYGYSFFNPPMGDKIMIIKPNAIKPGKHVLKVTLSNEQFNELLNQREMTMKFGFENDDQNFIFFCTDQLK